MAVKFIARRLLLNFFSYSTQFCQLSRYVAFDALGYKLITGVSQWVGAGTPSFLPPQSTSPPLQNINQFRRGDMDDFNNGPSHANANIANAANIANNAANIANNAANSGNVDESEGDRSRRPQDGSSQEMIVNSYQSLVQRYDSLVRNYQRLYMVRHRLSRTPSPPNTVNMLFYVLLVVIILSLLVFLVTSLSTLFL